MKAPLPDIVMSRVDHERLTAMLDALPPAHPVGDLLARELDRSDVVEPEDIPSDVVTMNSKVEVEDVATGERHAVTLVYPRAADFEAGRLSVLAPVGAALLGLRAGQAIEWPMPDGRTKQVRVVAVAWQPEAEGHRSL